MKCGQLDGAQFVPAFDWSHHHMGPLPIFFVSSESRIVYGKMQVRQQQLEQVRQCFGVKITRRSHCVDYEQHRNRVAERQSSRATESGTCHWSLNNTCTPKKCNTAALLCSGKHMYSR